jgi:TonB family protein
MNVSIPLADFAPAKLACLATVLRGQFIDKASITISIYSSPYAASHSMGFLLDLEDTKQELDAFAQLHARYVFDSARHEDYIEIIPMHEPYSRHENKMYNTRFNLPLSPVPHCRLEINNRCLVALEDAIYPREAPKRKKSGTVTVSGTIIRAGKIKDIRLVKAEVIWKAAESLLLTAAVQNLSTWRAEPAPRSDAIRITYTYVIDGSLPRVAGPQVQWALPDRVTITSPPE